MRYKRTKTRGYKLLRNTINLLLYTGIALALIFSVKHIFLDKKEMAHASQENFQISDTPSNEDYPSSSNENNSINQDVNQNHNADITEDKEEKKVETDNIKIEEIDEEDNIKAEEKDETENTNVEENNKIENINTSEDESSKADGEISLENSVFIGDSITEALSFYKFVSYSHVIADKGYTAKKALSDIDKVAKLNPDNIFIMLGLNDILTERSVDRYINNYTSLIQELKKSLPNADIYIQSILPVDPEVKTSKLALSNSQITEFNEGLKTLVQQENVHYLDIASIVKNYDGNLREPDGIHYKSKFCSLWLEYIKKNIQNS